MGGSWVGMGSRGSWGARQSGAEAEVLIWSLLLLQRLPGIKISVDISV